MDVHGCGACACRDAAQAAPGPRSLASDTEDKTITVRAVNLGDFVEALKLVSPSTSKADEYHARGVSELRGHTELGGCRA